MNKKVLYVVFVSSLLLVLGYTGFYVYSLESIQTTEYGLSNKYRKYERQENTISSSAILDIDTGDIVLISEYENQLFLGLYDPSFTFINEMQVSLHGVYRYFNQEDYKSGAKVGALVFEEGYHILDEDNRCKTFTSKRITETIFCLPRNSYLAEKEYIFQVVNQTSLDYLGDTIYIDSQNDSALSEFASLLLAHGYKEIGHPHHYVTYMIEFGLRNPRIAMMSTVCVSLYLLYIFCAKAICIALRKSISIHLASGGNFTQILYTFWLPYVVMNIATVVVCIGISLMLQGITQISVTFIVGVVSIIHVTYTSIVMYFVMRNEIHLLQTKGDKSCLVA